MAPKAMVFAMANPVPEILPDEAQAAGAAVVGTGRSDYPNQINNVLAFPGIFRGALDVRASDINGEMLTVSYTHLRRPGPPLREEYASTAPCRAACHAVFAAARSVRQGC